MPVGSPMPGEKAALPTLQRRVTNVMKVVPRLSRARVSESLRVSSASQQTALSLAAKKPIKAMLDTPLPTVLRPPDPTLFIQAGTSGVRHLFPIHLTESNITNPTFTRSISRLRSRTPTTKLCSNVEMIRNICLSIPTLRQFDISDNDLDEMPLDLCSLTDLETFDCSHNRLTHLPAQFEQWAQLKELDLSFNAFKRLPACICTLSHLLRFNAEHNLLRTIDADFAALRKLKILILDHNQLHSLDHIDFQLMSQLESVHMSHNHLTKFPRNLHQLKQLKVVNLSHNQLSSFPVDLLLINTLDVLNLSNNSIRKLPPLSDTYKRTALIFSIDLSFNQLIKFYEYLLRITRKLDLSNNQIHSVPPNCLEKFSAEMINDRELKMSHNPVTQSLASLDGQTDLSLINILPFIHQLFQEQQINQPVREGFKLCVLGCKSSGKSSLTYCLEENIPWTADGDNEEKQERIVNIQQFPFSIDNVTEPSLPSTKPAGQSQSNSARRNPSKPTSAPPKPSEPLRSLPLAIYDLNGSPAHYEHLSVFIDTSSLHLICIQALEFHRATPKEIEEIFAGTFSFGSSTMINELLQILQLLCEKATKTSPVIILPVATCIDLFDKQPKQNKIQALEKINRFFQLYLQSRLSRIKEEISRIESLPTISASLSDRLKTHVSLSNTSIRVESCQAMSALTFQGVQDVHQAIQKCILTEKQIFVHVDRVLPRLWADTNHSLESLADHLPIPYLFWDQYRQRLIETHGLSNLVDDITLSLSHQGKILVLNELGTSERLVFLRPLWLGDLLSAIFCQKPQSDSQLESNQKELLEHGLLHSDLLRSLWSNLLHRKDHFFSLWLLLMRFLFIAYPKINHRQMRSLFHSTELQFDYAIVPYYLPLLNESEQAKQLKALQQPSMPCVSICYRSAMLPFGLFHQYSVSALFKLRIIYLKHWNNFLLGRHEEKQVKFILQTDHRTYIKCHCATSIAEKPFDQIWNLLMLLINHFETLLRTLAPNNQFDRLVQCPSCRECSFMGEWITPKDLQSAKEKTCASCGENIDVNFLIQPNENKRRNEEILQKIRDRNAAGTGKKGANDPSRKSTSVTQQWVSPV